MATLFGVPAVHAQVEPCIPTLLMCSPQGLVLRLHAYGLATAPDACSLWSVTGAAAPPLDPTEQRMWVLLWQLVSGVSAARCVLDPRP